MPRFNPNDYDPKKDGAAFIPPPDGDYEFQVIDAEEKRSTNDNAMLNLTLAFDIGREKDLNVYDNLVFVPKAVWKIHQFCQAVGHDFSTGQIEAQDVIGMTGKAHLILNKPNDKGKRYMKVEWYCEREGYSEKPASQAPQPAATPDGFMPTDSGELPDDEDVPF